MWGSVGKVLPFEIEDRIRELNYPAIDYSLKDPERCVILEVDTTHWVVALCKIPFTNIYFIGDPWNGKKALSTKYKEITGSCHFVLKF